MNVEALHDLSAVRFDRFHAEIEQACDLFGRAPLGNELQDFPLARGEELRLFRAFTGRSRGATQEPLDDVPRNARREVGFAPHHGANEDGELVRSGVFHEIALRSSAERLSDVARVPVHAQNDEARLGYLARRALSELEPVQPGHRNVDQGNVGLRPNERGERLLAVARLGDDFHVGQTLQECANPRTHEMMIIRQKDPHWAVSLSWLVMRRPDEAAAWRENVLEAMLTALAYVVPIVAVLAVVLRASPRIDVTLVILVTTPVLFLALKLARTLSYPVRAGLTVASMLGPCLTFIALVGFSLGAGAGVVSAVVMSTLLLGRRVTLAMLAATTLVFGAAGLAIHWGALTPSYEDTDPRLLVNWVRMGISLALITGALAIAVEYVVRHIEKKYIELGAAYDDLAELTRKLETAKEEERRRVARELHDDLGQELTVLKLGLKTGKTTPFSDPVRIVDGLIIKVRELSRALRPALLDEVGLAAALNAYFEEQSTISGVAIELDAPDFDHRLSGDLEILCFRLVQEAVTNALRHAEPRRIGIRMQRANGALRIRIEDDGRGFDGPEALARAADEGHIGVVGMRERIRAVDGTFRIHSEPDRGTTIEVEIPLPA